MQNSRQVILGIVTALVSITLTLGVFLLSMAEGNLHTPTSTVVQTSSLSPTFPTIRVSWTPQVNTATPVLLTQTPTPELPTQTPTSSLTVVPSSTSCPHPWGWLPYTVRSGDSLNGLALLYRRTSAEISLANCLETNDLLPGLIIYLPPLSTRTPIPCGPSQNWVIYIIQPGDTLYRISRAYGVTVAQLQKANCLSGSLIRIGQSIYVPPWSPIFPSPTYDQMFETQTSSDTPSMDSTSTTQDP